MLPIATSNEDCRGKEQGFAEENTTSMDEVQKLSECGDFVLQIHKRSKSGSADLVLFGTGRYLCCRGAEKVSPHIKYQ